MLEKAKEHLNSAELLLTHGHYRDSVSRAYYAVFSLMWIYVGPPPKGKWDHPGLRGVFLRELQRGGIPVEQCRELRKRLHFLNKGREEADYATDSIDEQTAQDALNLAREVLKIVQGEKEQ